jgi:hypothetical protein
METMGELLTDISNNSFSCTFIFIPPDKTSTNSALIGRNYDYPAPFDKIARYLTVTVFLGDGDTIPCAIISLPGQLYCPTGVNAKGLFIELNNGTPSGGSYVSNDRQSILINLLQVLQNSSTLSQLTRMLNAINSDYSLIINAANTSSARSFEYSSTRGMQIYFPSKNKYFVSTNFYLSAKWKDIPVPTDKITWDGVTRRNNMLHLLENKPVLTIESFQKIMDRDIREGGAKFDFTIYQIIFDPGSLTLYLKIPGNKSGWSKISLKNIFSRAAGKLKAA